MFLRVKASSKTVEEMSALKKDIGNIASLLDLDGHPASFVLAGGYPTYRLMHPRISMPLPNDIDIYVNFPKSKIPEVDFSPSGFRVIEFTPYTAVLGRLKGAKESIPLQVIPVVPKGFSIETILTTFDNTLSQTAYDFSRNEFVVSRDLLKLLVTKNVIHAGRILKPMWKNRREKYHEKFSSDSLFVEDELEKTKKVLDEGYGTMELVQDYNYEVNALANLQAPVRQTRFNWYTEASTITAGGTPDELWL